MKKGGRSGESKRSKQRKLIQIKQSKQISPVKQVFQPEESRFITEKIGKITIPPIRNGTQTLSTFQIQTLSSHADALISVELTKSLIAKEQSVLPQFYEACPPIIKKAFQKMLKNVQKSFNIIRQQRIERMKEETVVFVPPDKDNFQRQKGKTLNNWIKQYIEVHDQKQNFETASQNYIYLFKQAQQKISELAIDVPKQKIEPSLQQIANGINDKNKIQLESRLKQVRAQIKQILQTTDQMRRIKAQVIEQKQKSEFIRQLNAENYLTQKYGSHTMALFSIQDYFV